MTFDAICLHLKLHAAELPMYKLKDYPPDAHFRDGMPQLNDDFVQMLNRFVVLCLCVVGGRCCESMAMLPKHCLPAKFMPTCHAFQ